MKSGANQKSIVRCIRDLSSLDATTVLLSNNTHTKETSVLNDASLRTLLDVAFDARGISGISLCRAYLGVAYDGYFQYFVSMEDL